MVPGVHGNRFQHFIVVEQQPHRRTLRCMPQSAVVPTASTVETVAVEVRSQPWADDQLSFGKLLTRNYLTGWLQDWRRR